MNDKNSKKKNSVLNSKNLIMLGIITVALVLFSMIVTYIIPKSENRIDRTAWNEAVSEAESAAASQAAKATANDDYNQSAKAVNSDSVPAESNSSTAQKPSEDTSDNPADTGTNTNTNTADNTENSLTSSAMQAPLEGAVVCDYSGDELVYSKTMDDWRCHSGVDISAAEGSDVHAAADGTVEAITDNGMYGSTVIILHDGGLRSIYSNLAEEIPVNTGDPIQAGAIIGKVGNTAAAEVAESPHLHFEVSLNEETVNPHDYLPSPDTPTEE